MSGGAAERLVESSAHFGRLVQQVADDQWDLPTPCPDWAVRDLVAHVVLGDLLLAEVLEGASPPAELSVDPSVLGYSPITAWRGTALRMIAAARAPGALERRYARPGAGPEGGDGIPGDTLVELRITEHLVHGWDLSTALRLDVPVPEHLAEAALEAWVPLGEHVAASGQFGEGPSMPPPGASAGVRLLHLLGRRP